MAFVLLSINIQLTMFSETDKGNCSTNNVFNSCVCYGLVVCICCESKLTDVLLVKNSKRIIVYLFACA